MGCQAPQERQAKGKAHGKEELGHDGVGVAAVGVVMLEHRGHDQIFAQEVHEQHPRDGVSAKLVE